MITGPLKYGGKLQIYCDWWQKELLCRRRYNAEFELETGKMVEPPFIAPQTPMEKYTLETYNLREEGNFIEIEE